MSSTDPRIIDASPTKELFIFMLVRDIPLIRSIIDLVDNSVDGARRLRPGRDFKDLWVRIEINREEFRISDNCGGIPVQIARDYAFRFGCPKDEPNTPGSVGQFGVGMKRSLFKLGTFFYVKSRTDVSEFVIEEDVEQWTTSPEWTFEFKRLLEGEDFECGEDSGTVIRVSPLHDSISAEFALETFLRKLNEELQVAHSLTMEKGLSLSLNGIPLDYQPVEFFNSAELKPAFFGKTYTETGSSPVAVKIYSGISERNIMLGGWYVFCNGRVVLEADQTTTTGWGAGGGKQIPKYHADFAYFRGCVFFDSDDAGLLPWTTTKTGIDSDSPLYKAVLLEMIKTMRTVLDFLRRLAAEKSESIVQGTETPLNDEVESTKKIPFREAVTENVFRGPSPPKKPPTPRAGRIQYSKPLSEISEVKKLLGVGTYKEVGERTFEYYLKYEGED